MINLFVGLALKRLTLSRFLSSKETSKYFFNVSDKDTGTKFQNSLTNFCLNFFLIKKDFLKNDQCDKFRMKQLFPELFWSCWRWWWLWIHHLKSREAAIRSQVWSKKWTCTVTTKTTQRHKFTGNIKNRLTKLVNDTKTSTINHLLTQIKN